MKILTIDQVTFIYNELDGIDNEICAEAREVAKQILLLDITRVN